MNIITALSRNLLLTASLVLAACSGGGNSPAPAVTQDDYDPFDFTVTVQTSTLVTQNVIDSVNNSDLTAKLNAMFALPANGIEIVFKDCGEVDAYYDPDSSQLVMCWDFLNELVVLGSTIVEAHDMFVSLVLFHALGHALIDQYDIPVAGSEEDVAEAIGVIFSLENAAGGIDAALSFLNLGTYFDVAGQIQWGDDHTTGSQRFADLVCMAIGAVPSLANNQEIPQAAIDEIAIIDASERNCGAEYIQKINDAYALIGIWQSPEHSRFSLSDITAISVINQPLNAEIELTWYGGDLEDLDIRIADQLDFERAGVPWQEWMAGVSFSVERNAKQGTALIRMSTDTPIQEASLIFLVKVNWDYGYVLKQYTLLLEP